MASIVNSITFDCAKPRQLAEFWAAVLDGTVDKDSDDVIAEVQAPDKAMPCLTFILVPEGKSVKNRVHLDLTPPDNMATEVERLVGLGARKIETVYEGGGYWTVMHDPEGNEFCVLRSAAERKSTQQ